MSRTLLEQLLALPAAFNATLYRLPDPVRRLSESSSCVACELCTPNNNLQAQTQGTLS